MSTFKYTPEQLKKARPNRIRKDTNKIIDEANKRAEEYLNSPTTIGYFLVPIARNTMKESIDNAIAHFDSKYILGELMTNQEEHAIKLMF